MSNFQKLGIISSKLLGVNIESKYWVVVPIFTSRNEFLAIAIKNYKKAKIKIFRIVYTNNFLHVTHPSPLQESIYLDDFYNFRVFFKYLIMKQKIKQTVKSTVFWNYFFVYLVQVKNWKLSAFVGAGFCDWSYCFESLLF